MKRLTSFYSEGELSSMRVSSVEETIDEVKGLFFREQLSEEQIMLEICGGNKGEPSRVDELRLDFDRIYSKKQILKKCLLGRYKFVDSVKYQKEFSIKTILSIKNEERYLNAKFKDFHVLLPRQQFFAKKEEPLLFASLKNNNYYLLNGAESEWIENKKEKNSIIKRVKTWIQNKISFRMSSRS